MFTDSFIFRTDLADTETLTLEDMPGVGDCDPEGLYGSGSDTVDYGYPSIDPDARTTVSPEYFVDTDPSLF